jgi:hypothetical protein
MFRFLLRPRLGYVLNFNFTGVLCVYSDQYVGSSVSSSHRITGKIAGVYELDAP